MKLDVALNAKKGIAFGITYRVISIIIPFLLQTIIRYFLSAEYIGIRGLFDSILTVLSMAELGFGSAIIYHMFKPIAEDDKEAINSLLHLYRKIYFFVGLIIFIFGCAILPIIPSLIKDSYPSEINLRVVFFLYLINSAFSYWFFAYKSSLLLAYQRFDIISVVNFIILLLSAIFQGIILIVFRNYYVFLFISIVATISRNLLSAYSANKLFPDLLPLGDISKDTLRSIKKNVSGLFVGNICGITRNTFDSIFITYFISLDETTIYSVYYFILISLNQISSAILSSLLAGVGNQIKLNDKDYNYENMLKVNSLYMVVSGWMTICFLCLVQPFVTLWMGVDYVFPFHIAILFPIYFYIGKLGDIRGVYSDGAGLFWENRTRYIFEIIANFILNYLFIKLFGTFGIVLATIFTLFFFGFLVSTFIIFKYYFKNGMLRYLLNQFKYFVVTGIISFVVYFICIKLTPNDGFLTIIIRGVLCILIPPSLYMLFLFKDKTFMNSIKFIYKIKK